MDSIHHPSPFFNFLFIIRRLPLLLNEQETVHLRAVSPTSCCFAYIKLAARLYRDRSTDRYTRSSKSDSAPQKGFNRQSVYDETMQLYPSRHSICMYFLLSQKESFS